MQRPLEYRPSRRVRPVAVVVVLCPSDRPVPTLSTTAVYHHMQVLIRWITGRTGRGRTTTTERMWTDGKRTDYDNGTDVD